MAQDPTQGAREGAHCPLSISPIYHRILPKKAPYGKSTPRVARGPAQARQGNTGHCRTGPYRTCTPTTSEGRSLSCKLSDNSFPSIQPKVSRSGHTNYGCLCVSPDIMPTTAFWPRASHWHLVHTQSWSVLPAGQSWEPSIPKTFPTGRSPAVAESRAHLCEKERLSFLALISGWRKGLGRYDVRGEGVGVSDTGQA